MPELRKDLITESWVIVATERAKRPQEFTQAPSEPETLVCPFCPGNESQTPAELWVARGSGGPNQPGWKVRVIPNKFPALRIEGDMNREADGIYDRMNGIGAHEVIIDTPDHNQALEEQPVEDIALALRACKERIVDLQRDERFRYVLVFKNVGRAAGASLKHSHYQVIATPVTPSRVKAKLAGARDYYQRKERSVFHDILRQEQREGSRVVFENNGFLVFCPFASRFPFELCLLPKRQSADFHTIEPDELHQLAEGLKVVLSKLSRGLKQPQYNLIIQTAPSRIGHRRSGYWDTIEQDFRWHIEILPRLTRTAGFEWGTGFYINPLPPENSAAYLRELTL
ncbi:MAG: galactose-1-phosphate uridylyltransferase [Verrucomicrobia bacterium]|nr:galactose-1-phosphate uridylyltransferase [Verrucomicrobiota bacterium]